MKATISIIILHVFYEETFLWIVDSDDNVIPPSFLKSSKSYQQDANHDDVGFIPMYLF